MSSPQLEKVYAPHQVEARWSKFWIEQGYFSPRADTPRTAYTIVIPPPNVTGSLHIGHALNNTLQDILVRWRRMQGLNTLWLPGTDHAGIATQNVVERNLAAEGKSKEELGREKFIEQIWLWKQQSGNTIIDQLKKLGASCDWQRLRFTMDEGLSKAVTEVFIRLHQGGLIYRGERLINWCPRCLTALSDIEVEHESINGKLYHIRYPMADDPNQFLIVATTRPETMLGDTGVAVHPEDSRYKHLIGHHVRLPLTSRAIPVIGDSILVDREFGTGAVKITPAHDFNDFEAGDRHGLPRIPILDQYGRLDPSLLDEAQTEKTLRDAIVQKSVQAARPLVIEALKKQGLVLNVEDHKMALGKCYRCKTIVEPYLSPQWFVKIQPLAEPAIKAVESGDIRIIPEGWTNNYMGWMRQIKDWCISRQIWWGHRIPAWYCVTCNKDALVKSDSGAVASSQDESILDAQSTNYFMTSQAIPVVSRLKPETCATCGGKDFLQDPDVLDTWFSSALWPFSTLGWPDTTEDLKTFYPTSTLVTGLDILFFWVARMIMMGLKFTGQPPFNDVYIHALVRDAEGQKMSKSKGNVIDPLTKMSQFGTDALRFTLASMASPGRDIKLAEERIEGYRNFTNKIWNAGRFILLNADGPQEACPVGSRSFVDQWILSRLNRMIQSTNEALEEYRFDHAAHAIYHFLWHEYCDWYLELIKPVLQSEDSPHAASTRHTLLETFETLQRILHPFMPFITEEIWQTLPHQGPSLVIQPYPKADLSLIAPEIEEEFELMEQFVTTARTARALVEYSPSKLVTLYGTSKIAKHCDMLRKLHPHLERLARGQVSLTDQDVWTSPNILRLVHGGTTVGIEIEGEVDLKKSIDRIRKQIQAKDKEASRLKTRLASPDFANKAIADVIQESTARLQSLTQELELLASSEQQLKNMSPSQS